MRASRSQIPIEFLLYCFATALVSVAVALYNGHRQEFDASGAHVPLAKIPFLVGDTSDSLIKGGGLTACTESMGTPGNPICFHAARMPVASVVVAFGQIVLGDSYTKVALMKTLLFLVPVDLAVYLFWSFLPAFPPLRWFSVFLLSTPFLNTQFLSRVVSLEVEEDYLCAFLGLAFALVLLPRRTNSWLGRHPAFEGALAGLAIGLTYLSKSSMSLVALVLLAAYLRKTSERKAIVVALLVALSAPVGWALHQHHASGRYSIGTSLDGFNLRKGNNAVFLSVYPLPPMVTLDHLDSRLNAGLSFRNEWEFDDYHRKAAVAFIESHPRQIMKADAQKLFNIFLSLQNNGGAPKSGKALLLERISILVFRLIFWAALLLSSAAILFRWRNARAQSLLFLALVFAVAVPYTLGFPFTRHVSILILPSVFMCCYLMGARIRHGDSLAEDSTTEQLRQGAYS